MKLKDEIDALEKAASNIRRRQTQIVQDAEDDAQLTKMQWIIDAAEGSDQKKRSG